MEFAQSALQGFLSLMADVGTTRNPARRLMKIEEYVCSASLDIFCLGICACRRRDLCRNVSFMTHRPLIVYYVAITSE